jgi:hypothetical protein
LRRNTRITVERIGAHNYHKTYRNVELTRIGFGPIPPENEVTYHFRWDPEAAKFMMVVRNRGRWG